MAENFIHFNSLAHLVQRSIHEKLTYDQFSAFEECCNSAYVFCESRPKLLFPLSVQCIEISDGIRNPTEYATIEENRKLQFPIRVPPKVILHVDELNIFLEISFYPSACDFIIERVKGIKTIFAGNQYYFYDSYHRLSEAFHIKKLTASLNKTEMELDTPNEYFDFSNIETVHLFRAHNLLTEKKFAAKAGKVFKTDAEFASLGEITDHVNLWKRGEWSFNHKIILQAVYGFAIEELAEKLEVYSMEFEDIFDDEHEAWLKYKWMLPRKNDPSLHLIICFWGAAEPGNSTVRILTFEQAARA